MSDNPIHGLRRLTVGPLGADVAGFTGAAVQMAVDAVAYRGGGTVALGPGTYKLIDAVRLAPDVALVGEGEVVLTRPDEVAISPLAVDADCGQREVTPLSVAAFGVGMGLGVYDQDVGWAFVGLPLRVRAVDGDRLLLEEMIPDLDRAAVREGCVANHFPLVLLREAHRARVENLELDGRARDTGGPLDEIRSAGLYSYRSGNVVVRGVRSHHHRGDGICIAHGSLRAVVEECETFENTHHGIHPGSHSAGATVRRCRIHHNGSDGLYVCWGVVGGLFEENEIHHNGARLWRSGLSIGHKDVDCLIARNRIYENCKYGICVREKTEANSAHRGTYRDNLIENNGQDPAEMPELCRRLPAQELVSVGVSVLGMTHDLRFEGNLIRETRPEGRQYQRHAVYLGPGTRRIVLVDNRLEEHPDRPVVDESGASDNILPADPRG